ncbi:hypothetical protein R0J90_19725, partial [Micrococcus sp. SIMBA_144]
DDIGTRGGNADAFILLKRFINSFKKDLRLTGSTYGPNEKVISVFNSGYHFIRCFPLSCREFA